MFIRDYDGTKYLVLLGLEKDNVIYDRIGYLVQLKGVLHVYVFSRNYGKIRINLDDNLPQKKT